MDASFFTEDKQKYTQHRGVSDPICYVSERTMKLGELLAKLRKERGILQKELANYLNVTVATISNYEKGVHAPDYETLVKLADFFDVSTDYLLQRTDYRSSISSLNERLLVDYKVSDLLNAILELDQKSMTALVDYYELLSLRNSMNAVKQLK